MATEGRGSQHFLKRGEANYHFEKEDQKEEKLLISALFGPQTHHSNTLHLHLLFMVVLIMAVVVIMMVVMIMIVVIYIQDKVNTADSAFIFLIIQSQSQWSGWSGRRRWSCLVWSLLER